MKKNRLLSLMRSEAFIKALKYIKKEFDYGTV